MRKVLFAYAQELEKAVDLFRQLRRELEGNIDALEPDPDNDTPEKASSWLQECLKKAQFIVVHFTAPPEDGDAPAVATAAT